MFELNGAYNKAKVFAYYSDETVVSQIIEILNQPFTQGSNICIMPDCHAGKGCVVGTTMTITDKVVPNLVGVDIGCGMLTVPLKDTSIDFAKLDEAIYTSVPAGPNIHETPINEPSTEKLLKNLRCFKHINLEKALHSLGSLGGGNHFIEIDQDITTGQYYLIIHSGSRHLGIEVCNYYQQAGLLQQTKELREATIKSLKESHKESEIEKTLRTLPKVTKNFAYCTGQLLDDYLHDMRITQEYAARNRYAMSRLILANGGLHEAKGTFDTVHNYIDTDSMILRKGSISAQKGEKVLIPLNMADGCLICEGKGNPNWNYSAPHGAGRMFSRSQAKELFDLEEFKKTMFGVYTSSVCEATLDESPMAYKASAEILLAIEDTVDVIQHIYPVYNFKAH